MNKISIIVKMSGILYSGVFAANQDYMPSGQMSDHNSETPKPNIVFIIADDLGYSDLGCFGGEAETPNLDKLAQQGVRFTNFYNAGKCEPTRVGLMTGHRNTTQIGFLGERAKNFLPELLKNQDYRTLITGKWHISRHPIERGFNRFFGHLEGGSNFWTGSGRLLLDYEPYQPEDGYFSTDAFTDYALQFLDEARQENDSQPFFLYLSYTAPHAPLQAHDEDIAKYRGDYLIGWHRLKEKRHNRVRELGLISPSAPSTPWPENLPQWEDLTDEQKDMEDYRMATYTAMIDRMDQNIGRVFDWLKSNGKWDNTLIIFISDNGADPFDRNSDQMIQGGILPGGPESRWSLGTGWAHVSNTPYRLYKRNMHKGGICAPMIMHWPEAGYEAGSLSALPIHILDFLPTFYNLAGGESPLQEIEGTDISNLWRSGSHHRDYEMMGYLVDHRYFHQNDWKLVSMDSQDWELFYLPDDPNETNDLHAVYPERVIEMDSAWNDWYYGFSRNPFIDPDEDEDKRLRRIEHHMGDKGTGVPYEPVELPGELEPGWPAFWKLNLGGRSFGKYPLKIPEN